jgi:hypothetical protein
MRRQSAVAVSRPVCTGPCAGGSGGSEALELKGKVTAVLARQLAVGWRPGTPETHRTPGPESGCNKPEDLDHAVRRSGEEPHGRHHSRGWQPRPNDEALGRSREKWSVPRVRRWRGTLGNARRGGLAKVSPASSAAPRRRRQGHGGRQPRFLQTKPSAAAGEPRSAGPVTGQAQGGRGKGQRPAARSRPTLRCRRPRRSGQLHGGASPAEAKLEPTGNA